MEVRDHKPIVIETFGGIWSRGRQDSCPVNHFIDALNTKFEQNGVLTRDGITTIPGPEFVTRMYRYKTTSGAGEGLILLDTNGDFWHQTYDPDTTTLILQVPTADDFAMIEINGRAYISPITGIHGTSGEFLYVYLGDGNPARQAGGDPPVNSDLAPLVAYNSEVDGKVDMGIHVIAVSYDAASDLSTALGPDVFAVVYAPGNKEINVNNIPISGSLNRMLFMTRAIDPKDYDPSSLPTFYEALAIGDATTTDAIISVTDAELVTPFSAGSQAQPEDGGALNVEQTGAVGYCDLGLHIYGVVYETDTGYITAPGPEFFAVQTHVNERMSITITNIPVSPDSFVTKRHIVATRMLLNYNGDQAGFQFYFIPSGTINDNTTQTLEVSFYDVDLIEDASHLIDNYADIPAGAFLATYNGRLVTGNGDMGEGVAILSAPGEPEAIDQVDGVLTPPNITEQINNAVEFRDVLYIFKTNRTYAYVDNGDVPTLWDEPTTIDNGIGAGLHSISTVLDSRGVNVEYIIVGHEAGLYLFTGTYMRPELSWKIETLWKQILFSVFSDLQIFTESINKRLYMTLPTGNMFYADYSEGLDPKSIKWMNWEFPIPMSTIALLEGTRLLLASEGEGE